MVVIVSRDVVFDETSSSQKSMSSSECMEPTEEQDEDLSGNYEPSDSLPKKSDSLESCPLSPRHPTLRATVRVLILHHLLQRVEIPRRGGRQEYESRHPSSGRLQRTHVDQRRTR